MRVRDAAILVLHAVAIFLVVTPVPRLHAGENAPSLDPRARALSPSPSDAIELTTSAATIAAGQTFVVELVVNVQTAASGFGVQLEFDPGDLAVVIQSDPDGTPVPVRTGPLFQSAQRIKNTLTPIRDQIQIDAAYTLPGSEAPVRGTFAVATVRFRVLHEAATQVRLLDARLIEFADTGASDRPVRIVNSALALNATRGSEWATPSGRIASAGASTSWTWAAGLVAAAVVITLLGVLPGRVVRRRVVQDPDPVDASHGPGGSSEPSRLR